ncbi:DsbA family protein [Salmonella enterica]
MIRKSYLLFIFLFISSGVYAGTTEDKRYYSKLSSRVESAPPVVQFFSFYCPGCYQYEQVLGVGEHIKKVLPADVSLVRYHVGFMGPMGQELTRAWSVATVLRVEDRVIAPLFTAVQKTRSIRTEADIRQVFVAAGVDGGAYDAAWNSSAVKSQTGRQETLARALQLTGVPSVYVNGQYRVNPDNLDKSSPAAFAGAFSETVRHLLAR